MKFLVALAVLLFVGAASARNGTVSTNGNGVVTVVPDIAKVSLSVSATRKSVIDARDDAAEATAAVLDALSAVQGLNASRDVATTDISVSPQYVRCAGDVAALDLSACLGAPMILRSSYDSLVDLRFQHRRSERDRIHVYAEHSGGWVGKGKPRDRLPRNT